MNKSVLTEYQTLYPHSLQLFIEMTPKTLSMVPVCLVDSEMFLPACSPVCPEEMDWSELYPHFFTGDSSEKQSSRVEFADIGCGYGGLLGT